MAETVTTQATAPRSAFERGVSLFELVFGIGIVVAHNVFHAVPNEVPILLGLGLLSLFMRDGGVRAIGWVRPKSWLLTLFWGIATAAVVVLCGEFVSDPLAQLI